MDKPKVKIHFFETYLAVIRNSVGSKLFRNFYLELDGKKMDATKNGVVSCAFFVSNVLNMFPSLKLIKEPHLTVKATVKDLLESGWKEISEPRLGAVLVWEEKESHGGRNKHIGFYIGDGAAISNNADTGMPDIHHWTFGGDADEKPARSVEMILWNSSLEKSNG